MRRAWLGPSDYSPWIQISGGSSGCTYCLAFMLQIVWCRALWGGCVASICAAELCCNASLQQKPRCRNAGCNVRTSACRGCPQAGATGCREARGGRTSTCMSLSFVCTLELCVGRQNASEYAKYTVVSGRARAPVRHMTMLLQS